MYSISGKRTKYRDLRDATGDGLCGWNCYHNFFPFFEGVSERTFEREVTYDGKSNAQLYEEGQRQRALERAVQASKREVTVIDSALQQAKKSSPELAEGLEKDFQRASVTLNNRRRRLDEHIEQTGSRLSQNRTMTAGFGHGTSSRAVWAAKKAQSLTNTSNKGTMKLSLQLFGEADLRKQSTRSIEKGIKSYTEEIALHKQKLENPSKFDPAWEYYTDKHKQGLINHWKKEIRNFETSIQNRTEELERRMHDE